MKDESADVLVIGAGAGGAALSWRLASQGARVVCLEQGDWVKPADYPSSRNDYEIQIRRGAFNFSPNIRKRPEDYPVVEAGGDPPSILMFNAVGGSTIHFAGHFPRLHPSDFRVKTLDGAGDDWPIRYDDLEPYYDLNDRMMGVSGLAGDPANPPSARRPTPALPLGAYGEAIGRGFDKLGWHWWAGDNAIVSRPYDGRPACDAHGKCEYGCPIGAKSSADVSYWPKALKSGVVLRTWSRVREITVNDQGRATGALYYDREGNLREQLARVVVLCGNGVGTPRLLLNSRSKLFPQGLANSNGAVGKNFMLHPWSWIGGIFEEVLDGHDGAFGVPVFSHEFYETDPARGFLRGYTLQVGRTFGPLSQAWPGRAHPAIPWGAGHHRAMRRRFPHFLIVGVQGEDLPEESNRVELDAAAADSNGIPAPRVVYRISDNSHKLLEHGSRMARQALEAAGAMEIVESGPTLPAWHLMGTARMGNVPRSSVVNAWHQAHDVKNLFIVDGSSFTTCGAVNPTSTIGALALRCADLLWIRRREFC